GQRIANAETALKSCLARRCPPNEDIDATLVLAETQILAGKYRDARKTLLKSLGRNKHVARQYPVPLSELYRANGRVAAHLGFDRDYYSSTWGIFRTLKEGLPNADERHFTARMEIAEMMFRTRGHSRARLYYEDLAKDARAAGRPDIAALAELRSVLNHLPPYMRQAEVRKIAESDDPATRAASLQAKLALARLAYERNDVAEAEAIQRSLASYNFKRPILIYSPAYEMSEQQRTNDREFGIAMNSAPGSGGLGNPGGANGGRTATSSLPLGQFSTTHRISRNYDDMWVDVAFRISPDGTVSDLRIARSKGDTFWAKPLLKSIGGRRYTPAKEGSPGTARLERYTYTSGYEEKSDSNMAGRSPNGRVEFIDLSAGGLTETN
ncbi:MAG TPA: hypothetical protein VGD23_00790, partial [Sphingomicrobium sp.]